MTGKIAVDSEAPNFDLTSTEDVVLMLRDEVTRMAVVLYFFADPDADKAQSELRVLADRQPALKAQAAAIMGISLGQAAGTQAAAARPRAALPPADR